MNRLRRAGVVLAAAVIPVTGACSQDVTLSGEQDISPSSEPATSVAPDTTQVVPPRAPNAPLGVSVECQTRLPDLGQGPQTIVNLAIEQNSQTGAYEIAVGPEFLGLSDNAPQSIKDEFAAGSRRAVIEKGTEPFLVTFQADALNLPGRSYSVGVTDDGTVTADIVGGSGVSAQALNTGEYSIGNVVVIQGDDSHLIKTTEVAIDGRFISGSEAAFISEGASRRSPDVLSTTEQSYVVDVLVPEIQAGCSAGVGARFIERDF